MPERRSAGGRGRPSVLLALEVEHCHSFRAGRRIGPRALGAHSAVVDAAPPRPAGLRRPREQQHRIAMKIPAGLAGGDRHRGSRWSASSRSPQPHHGAQPTHAHASRSRPPPIDAPPARVPRLRRRRPDRRADHHRPDRPPRRRLHPGRRGGHHARRPADARRPDGRPGHHRPVMAARRRRGRQLGLRHRAAPALPGRAPGDDLPEGAARHRPDRARAGDRGPPRDPRLVPLAAPRAPSRRAGQAVPLAAPAGDRRPGRAAQPPPPGDPRLHVRGRQPARDRPDARHLRRPPSARTARRSSPSSASTSAPMRSPWASASA